MSLLWHYLFMMTFPILQIGLLMYVCNLFISNRVPCLIKGCTYLCSQVIVDFRAGTIHRYRIDSEIFRMHGDSSGMILSLYFNSRWWSTLVFIHTLKYWWRGVMKSTCVFRWVCNLTSAQNPLEKESPCIQKTSESFWIISPFTMYRCIVPALVDLYFSIQL